MNYRRPEVYVRSMADAYVNYLSCIFLAEVRMPSGSIDQPIIEDNRDGTVSVRYLPKEEGSHELGIKYNGIKA